MNTPEKIIEKRGLKWALVGPIAAFTTTAILLIKSAFIYLPLTVVIAAGIYASWKWRMRGLIFALAALAVFTVFFIPYLHANSFYWNFGVFASIAMAYLITSLCGSEWDAAGVDNTNSVNDQIRAQALQIQYLEASLKTAENEWANERAQLRQDHLAAEQQVSEKESLVHAHAQTLERVRKELEATKVRQEILEADLCDQRQEVRNAYKHVENAKLEVEALSQAKEQLIQDQAKLAEWQDSIQKRQDTLPDTHDKLHRAHDEIQALHNQLDKVRDENQALLQVKEQLIIEQNNQLSLHKQIADREDRILALHNQLETSRSEIQSLLAVKEQLITEQNNNHALQYELLTKEDSIKTINDQLKSTERKTEELSHYLAKEKEISAHHLLTIASSKAEIQSLQDKHSSAESLLNNSIHQLNQEKHALESAINEKLALIETLTLEKEKLQHKLAKNRVERRNDGMYLQMRQQFAEKSQQLDSARQQLFVTQENMLALQNTLAETQIYDRNELLTAVESNLAELDKEFEALKQSSLKEIDSLHQIINKLLQ